jgi:hypothetical protein
MNTGNQDAFNLLVIAARCQGGVAGDRGLPCAAARRCAGGIRGTREMIAQRNYNAPYRARMK